jgi:hypothetical protein
MRRPREHQIVEYVGIEEQALHECHQAAAYKPCGVCDRHPNHQMHPLSA